MADGMADTAARPKETCFVPLSSPKSQRTVAALTGAGALMGWLLASGAAAPVIADVVALVNPATSTAAAEASSGTTLNGKRVELSDSRTSTVTSSDTWMNNDQRAEWSSERQVPQGPSGLSAVQQPVQPQTPAIQVPENPKGRNLFLSAAPMTRHELKPRGACPQSHGKGLRVGHLSAEPGIGSVTISWWDLGDPNTSEYHIEAVSMNDGSVTTKIVAAPKTCRQVTTVIRGLTSGTGYVFMLTAMNTSPEQHNRLYRVDRGQTPTITIR